MRPNDWDEVGIEVEVVGGGTDIIRVGYYGLKVKLEEDFEDVQSVPLLLLSSSFH
jgi:hypothetical protein